jgi:DNA-binding SARP family transcriptional activator
MVEVPLSAQPGQLPTPAVNALRLLSGFRLTRSGAEIAIPSGCQRLVALLAVNGYSSRTVAAGTLWPDVPDDRASGNLRTSLWRVNRQWPGLIEVDEHGMELSGDVHLDTDELTLRARAVADPAQPLAPDSTHAALVDGGDLLPGWYEDWVILQRERLRLLRLHALEQLSGRLLSAGQYVWAMEAAMAAVRAEPLRESAQRAVIAVHIANGNAAEARRHFAALVRLLRAELGVEPSPQLRALADSMRLAPTPARVPPTLPRPRKQRRPTAPPRPARPSPVQASASPTTPETDRSRSGP